MKLIDLSLAIPEQGKDKFSYKLKEKIISSNGVTYTGIMYDFVMDSMDGTYLDLPGHIKETDDGYDMQNYPLEKLYRLKTAVIHLDRPDGSGAVTSEDLTSAFPHFPQGCGAMIINALGKKRFNEIEERSVYLSADAVKWIIDSGIHMLISDIYESKAIHGVFLELFSAGVSTVCCPVNLHLIKAPFCLTSIFAIPAKSITQIPCRLIAEL